MNDSAALASTQSGAWRSRAYKALSDKLFTHQSLCTYLTNNNDQRVDHTKQMSMQHIKPYSKAMRAYVCELVLDRRAQLSEAKRDALCVRARPRDERALDGHHAHAKEAIGVSSLLAARAGSFHGHPPEPGVADALGVARQ
jgi:hypothetical protein